MRQHIRRALALCLGIVPVAASAEGLSELSRGWVFDEHGGAALFANICAACHQPNAKGAVGAGEYPALAEDRNLASAEYLESLLFNGRRAMPPLGSMMNDQQVADVVNYVRTHFGNSYGYEVTAADVKAERPRR